MAFKDIEKILYNGQVKINYLDKPHMYFKRMRENWDLPESDPKAWGKAKRPKGTTTLLGDTLEKKGLLTWPMGLALRELFGFYDFTNEKGEKMTGFSTGVGTLWDEKTGTLLPIPQDDLLPFVQSASKAHLRKKKKGADIGSVVHDAIEHYIKGQPFDIAESYMWSIKEGEYESDAEKDRALRDFQDDVKQANLAFEQFTIWWDSLKPTLLGAEDLIYSLELDYSGTFDGLIEIPGAKHPVLTEMEKVIVLCDWKTSNASASKDAAAPMGVYYSYFIQSAMYALAWHEMGNAMPDDLAIVSCRKDGGFDVVYATELGLSMDDLITWARSVIQCYRFMDKSKKGLNALGAAKEVQNVTE